MKSETSRSKRHEPAFYLKNKESEQQASLSWTWMCKLQCLVFLNTEQI